VPGATSKEQTVQCSNGECVRTTTYRDQAGQTIKQEQQRQDEKSFCQQNPTLSICKETAFSGSCAGGGGNFSCNGDAVQCALTREVHRRNCEWAQVDNLLKTTGLDAMNGQAQPAGHPGASAQQQSLSFATVIDQAERIGSGCPADVSIAYAGRSWVIPWSQHCSKLQLIGNLMVSVCMLAAAFIVFRS
jgi:hypothetical protein